jgi:hypothetical protein
MNQVEILQGGRTCVCERRQCEAQPNTRKPTTDTNTSAPLGAKLLACVLVAKMHPLFPQPSHVARADGRRKTD